MTTKERKMFTGGGKIVLIEFEGETCITSAYTTFDDLLVDLICNRGPEVAAKARELAVRRTHQQKHIDAIDQEYLDSPLEEDLTE